MQIYNPKRKLNKINSLPFIKLLSKKKNDYSSNNISATTNTTSKRKNNVNSSSIISNKAQNSHRILKKIKLNNNYHPHRSINKSQIYSYNAKRSTIEILENADQIMKERLKFHEVNRYGMKNLIKNVAIRNSKEVSLQNYTINLLKEKRTEINKKELLINKSLREYDNLFENDYKNFMNFIEDVKYKEKYFFDTMFTLKQLKYNKEQILENEKLLNKKLIETLKRTIKGIYIIIDYASFFHKIIEQNCIYDKISEVKGSDKTYEEISDLLINIYETKDKFNKLPKELGNIDKFIKKYNELEEKIISELAHKDYLDKEIKKIQNSYYKELEQLNISKIDYENDFNNLNEEKKCVNKEAKSYKFHENENFYNNLQYIIELGKEIGPDVDIPTKIDKDYLNEFLFYSKTIKEKLRNTETIINNNILEIQNILDYGNKEDKALMEQLIQNQKNINIRENQIKLKLLQEEMKKKDIAKIYERGRKIIIKGRKVFINYPINKDKIKINIKKIIKKEKDENIDCKYSETTDEIKY